jgi:hypothetical protein
VAHENTTKGTGSPDRIQMFWQKWILRGLTYNPCWFLDFSDAPLLTYRQCHFLRGKDEKIIEISLKPLYNIL